jgi:hypothetical protein
MNILITPALSLDPSLLCTRAEDESAFRTVLGGSPLNQARRFGRSHLFLATDILNEIRTVADLFFCATNGGKETVSLLGGYAFLDADRFLFGAEHAYPFHRQWELAFKHIEHTSPVKVVIDQHTSKLIRQGANLIIYTAQNEFVFPFDAFSHSAAKAVIQNKDLQINLASEFRLRFRGAEADLLNQLL